MFLSQVFALFLFACEYRRTSNSELSRWYVGLGLGASLTYCSIRNHPRHWAACCPSPITGLRAVHPPSLGCVLSIPHHWALCVVHPPSLGCVLSTPITELCVAYPPSLGCVLSIPHHWAVCYPSPITALCGCRKWSWSRPSWRNQWMEGHHRPCPLP